MVSNKISPEIARAPAYGIELEIYWPADPRMGLRVVLEDACRSVYLPERKYAYGSLASDQRDKKSTSPFVQLKMAEGIDSTKRDLE